MDNPVLPALAGSSVDANPSTTHWSPALPAPASQEVVNWTEEEIVYLHWRLLQELGHLGDPATPLEEKLDTLRWIFTEQEKDGRPFSFSNCLRVVGCSPLSPIDYCGSVDADLVRQHVHRKVKPWLQASLQRYPQWVRHAVAENPAWVERQLALNPQWINEQLKHMESVGDLFEGFDHAAD